MQILKLWFANAKFSEGQNAREIKGWSNRPFYCGDCIVDPQLQFHSLPTTTQIWLCVNDIRRKDRISTTKAVAQLTLLSFQDKNPVV